MKLSNGEFLDKLSILILRVVNGDTPADLIDYLREFNNKDAKRLVDLIEINNKIWKLESDIRLGKEGKLSMADVGRRALQIRDHNKIRVLLKNETKINHAST
jgi:hypothetical protein